MHAGIVIVGGNILGASVAAELARRADPLRDPVAILEEAALEERGPATATIVEEPGGAMRAAFVDGARALLQFEARTGRGIGLGRPGLIDLRTDEDHAEAIAEALEVESVDGGTLDRRRALCDVQRLHAEVLALGRTRGVITRPGTCVERIEVDGDRVLLHTLKGEDDVTWEADRVVITDPGAVRRFFPALAEHLRLERRVEVAFESPRFASGFASGFVSGFVSVGTVRGSVGDLHDVFESMAAGAPAADPLTEFFAAGEQLDYPHPVIRGEGFDVYPNPLDRQVIVASPGSAYDPAVLARFSPLFAELQPVAEPRHVRLARPSDDIPVIGPAPGYANGRVFVAAGLDRRAAQLASGLAPGVAAHLFDETQAVYDPAVVTPARFA